MSSRRISRKQLGLGGAVVAILAAAFAVPWLKDRQAARKTAPAQTAQTRTVPSERL